MHPYLWGDPAQAVALPEAATSALAHLGATAGAEPVAVSDIALPEPALPGPARAAITDAVGADHVSSDHDARIAHTRGWSTPDLLRLRAGDATDAPDAVVCPGTHEEVLAVLSACSRHRIAVVPFCGGTSVVGGLNPARDGFAGVIALDLRRMDGLLAVDPVSRTATLQAGVRGPHAERLLSEHGLTLGHFPQSYEGASIGGYAAARSAGQSSAGYGRFDEMVVGIVLATPSGTVELGSAPMSAAGPDLRQLVLGSEGALGVITSVTVRVRPAPEQRVYEGWRFPSFEAGAAALRRLAQDGPLPTVLRLSDEAETAVNLADPGGALGGGPGGCLAIVGHEGSAVSGRQAAVREILLDLGGEPLGPEPGEAWREGRFRAPYLRDPLLSAGALVETLETATFWSNLPALRTAVTDALTGALAAQGTPALVLCHISHVYETGASLYFTVVCAQKPDAVAQWREAKAAANAAIRGAGATITHHHGVGTDHRATYAEEIGPLAVDVLRSVKRTVDPAGVLNPGVLLS
ncbi:FAD-binding oxidoreductase [Saccharopolyspora taberi]|uniref:FAD-binding oxidoreductase n=1 Tax=Saccharopolyspora taberi TaxID=60895 RepID=A0ABN3V273_9PSEU